MLAIAVALIDAIVIWLIGPFGLLGLIAGLTAITFVLARRFAGVHAGSHTGMHTEARAGLHAGARPPETRLRLGARIALWLGEIAAAWSLFLFWLPLERWLMPRDRPGRSQPDAEGASAAPVLLIHGYVNNAGAMWRLWRALVDKSFGVYTLNLEPVYAGIERLSSPLREARHRVWCGQSGHTGQPAPRHRTGADGVERKWQAHGSGQRVAGAVGRR